MRDESVRIPKHFLRRIKLKPIPSISSHPSSLPQISFPFHPDFFPAFPGPVPPILSLVLPVSFPPHSASSARGFLGLSLFFPFLLLSSSLPLFSSSLPLFLFYSFLFFVFTIPRLSIHSVYRSRKVSSDISGPQYAILTPFSHPLLFGSPVRFDSVRACLTIAET